MPKQYREVAGKTVLQHTLEALLAVPGPEALVVVAAQEWQESIEEMLKKVLPEQVKFLGFSLPGENRQLSIFGALSISEECAAPGARVMIHDGVRPCISPALLSRCGAAAKEADGVMPYLPMKDTVYESSDGVHITGSLPRERLYAGQTPEYFDFHKYLAACRALSREEILAINGSTEPAIKAGMQVLPVPGEEGNFKITTPEDMARFEKICAEKER